jgi:hypothetical protein
MAAMSTALTEFSQNGNSRTSTITGHTAVEPKLVIEKRRVPEGGQSMAEYSFKVVEATTDVDDIVLPQKVTFECIVRYPLLGDAAIVTAALAVIRDIVAGDEFGNSVTTQEWLT